MFKIESYVTPILLSYVDKYVKDFNPADAQVSLWGGGVALHNLVIKTDVLQQEVSLPFTLVSGRIHELLIQVPWTKIMSEPIVVTIDIIECILSLRPPPSEETQAAEAPPSTSHRQRVETPPGYMQALVRRIVSNISIQVHHLILKYVQDDMVMSLNIKHLCVQSTGTNWQPTFADIDQNKPEIRRLVTIDDLTLCLDSSDADGKIRFYQEPLLYRCRIEARVLMKLESANNRRASSISCYVYSDKLAFSVSSEQLVLILRLIKEHTQKTEPTPKKTKSKAADLKQSDQPDRSSPTTSPTIKSGTPKQELVAESAPSEQGSFEPVRTESWSEWAWSWMPSWADRMPDRAAAVGVKEPPPPARPTPIDFDVYLNEMSFAFKIMEMEGSARKRTRNLIEFSAVQNVLRGSVNWPTLVKAKYGVRAIYLKTAGACTCGHLNFYALNDEPTYYLSNAVLPEAWEYPRDSKDDDDVVGSSSKSYAPQLDNVREKTRLNLLRSKLDKISEITEGEKEEESNNEIKEKEINVKEEKEDGQKIQAKKDNVVTHNVEEEKPESEAAINNMQKSTQDDVINIDFIDLQLLNEQQPEEPSERFWRKMAPVISVTFCHERAPNEITANPYENIPTDFEYSDWQEECNLFISVQPLDMDVGMGLIHRLVVIKDMFANVFVPTPLPPPRRLTVEECESLSHYLPQRKISIEVHGFSVSVHPMDHSLVTRAISSPIILDIDMPKTNLILVMPLYPLRVCSAASQLPKDETSIWRGANLHFTGAISNAQILVASGKIKKRKPCGRFDVRFVVHSLMCRPYFESRHNVNLSYVMKMRELNISGSAPRLFAAAQVLLSYVNRRFSAGLRYSTIPKDAFNDEDLVALDINVEDFRLRGFFTNNVTTKLATLQTIRATLCQNKPGKDSVPKQAWLFAGPDVVTSSPLLRFGFQFCETPGPAFVDYLTCFTEHIAIAIDPLLIEWLAYKPYWKVPEMNAAPDESKRTPSLISKRRPTPPNLPKPTVSQQPPPFTEQVHVRRNSQESSSGPSEKKEKKEPPPKPKPPEMWWEGEGLSKIHQRLKKVLISFDMSLILLYMTTKTASAVDCATVSLTMENHALREEQVIVFSAGRWSLVTSLTTTHLWHFIEKNGPTYKTPNPNDDKLNSFPWKMTIADISCYSIEATPELILQRMDKPTSLKSQLKYTRSVQPRHFLEHVTTCLTLSVVTKTLQHKIVVKKAEMKTTQVAPKRDAKLKYFESSHDFVPTSLKDFLRGPKSRKRDTATGSGSPSPVNDSPENISAPVHVMAEGALVSLGFQLHADTPPVCIRMEHDQMPVMAVIIHCLEHLVLLLKTRSMQITRPRSRSRASVSSRSSLPRGSLPRGSLSHGSSGKAKSTTELQDLDERSAEMSESESEELQVIYQHRPNKEAGELKTFILFQWVINTVTLLMSTEDMKLTFYIDDVITTIDLQHTYNQLKVKIAGATIKHFVRNMEDQWVPGALGGRVLEAREPANALQDEHFLCITITQAQICNLPPSWKEELHPKLLEQKCENDKLWEIYAVLAPLEIVIQPNMIDNFLLLTASFAPPYFCDLSIPEEKKKIFDLPFVYLNMGALRVIVSCPLDTPTDDNTILLTVSKISINPHPDNPICRRTVTHTETSWQAMSGSLDGRQYELSLKEIAVLSTKFSDIICEEEAKSASSLVPGGENPAKKWSEPLFTPELTTILHPIDLNILLAPPLFLNNALACGSAIELNLVSDCAIELSISQLHLINELVGTFKQSLLVTSSEYDNADAELDCPYVSMLEELLPSYSMPSSFVFKSSSQRKDTAEAFTATADSGVETATSQSTFKSDRMMSICFADSLNPADFKEMCITMGVIELSLYVAKDNSREVQELMVAKPKPSQETSAEVVSVLRKVQSVTALKSIANVMSENIVRTQDTNVPLMHMTLYQPNLYYWKRKNLVNLQVSLFNVWMGLGVGKIDGHWFAPLLTTTKGELDPITEIPPALVTCKYYSGNIGSPISIVGPSHGTFDVDMERPLKMEVSTDSLKRLLKIAILISSQLKPRFSNKSTPAPDPPLNRLKQALEKFNIEEVKIVTTQIAFGIQEIMAGWDSSKTYMKYSSRPEGLDLKSLIQAFVVTKTTVEKNDFRAIMQPLHIGCKIMATWDAWRRAEGPLLANEPSVYLNLDFNNLAVDVTPETPAVVQNMAAAFESLHKEWKARPYSKKTVSIRSKKLDEVATQVNLASDEAEEKEEDHYYKDDLRSGAFKIVYGSHIPMPYQVTLYKDIISWSYPHPRAITRILVYPMLFEYEEIDCVLEFYNRILLQWEPYASVELPLHDEKEYDLQRQVQDMIFAYTWRFKLVSRVEEKPFSFDMKKFEHRVDLLQPEDATSVNVSSTSAADAERISGILRVDSYFAPRLTPRFNMSLRVGSFELNVHNSVPYLSNQVKVLHGYYVSNLLLRSHRVLCIIANDVILHGQFGSPAGQVFLLKSKLSTNLIDCSTGSMVPMTKDFTFQTGLSIPNNILELAKIRFFTSRIQVDMNIPRLRTLHCLADDWIHAFKEKHLPGEKYSKPITTRHEVMHKAAEVLEGRVALWVHNSCSAPLRLGQVGTDEVILMEAGAKVAYRWDCPFAPKRLRVALADIPGKWRWSNDVPFTEGTYKLRLEVPEGSAVSGHQKSEVLFVVVQQNGAHRKMQLSGRLVLANMLRTNLHYKVRARRIEQNACQTIATNELDPESIGHSIICPATSDIVLKIRFAKQNTGWSGDIPLKECPKENVPWLVKVPSEGDLLYISVWCRVVNARSDGRIFASIWPLYVIVSHLSLDIDVLLVTEMGIQVSRQEELTSEKMNPPPLIQSVEGRGTTTHLLCPGTTAARHTLSFQYRNIECPVTREAVPLHYGVTDTSVFEKQPPIYDIRDVIKDVTAWLKRSGRDTSTMWPYSIVASHWSGQWHPAMLQPKSDVSVRYQAVKAGGGCSLQVQICPVLLMCNASPMALTVRAHDAAPLCKLEPGTVIALPSLVLHRPFFVSIEVTRNTFVSIPLRVGSEDPGRYGTLPDGVVTLDHPVSININCNQKLVVLNLHYEIKEEINVMGVTSAYVFVNELDTAILISSLVSLSGEVLKRVQHIDPRTVPAKNNTGTSSLPLVEFSMSDQWRGRELSEEVLYICLSLVDLDDVQPVLVRLGQPPARRSISMRDNIGLEVAVVVTQHKHEGRWVVAVQTDPCPQFVVHNLTSTQVAVAMPIPDWDQQLSITYNIETQEEFPGSLWRCVIDMGDSVPYSGPDYVIQGAATDYPQRLTYLTFSINYDNEACNEKWMQFCRPVAVTEGEQLVRLRFGHLIKMRVHCYPHSTLIELRDINYDDLSARDIRTRLLDTVVDDLVEEMDLADAERRSLDTENVPTDIKKSTVDAENVVASTEETTIKPPENEKKSDAFDTTMENVRSRLNLIKTALVSKRASLNKSLKGDKSEKNVRIQESAQKLQSQSRSDIKLKNNPSRSTQFVENLGNNFPMSRSKETVRSKEMIPDNSMSQLRSTESSTKAKTSNEMFSESKENVPNQTDEDFQVLAPKPSREDERIPMSASYAEMGPTQDENQYDWENRFPVEHERMRCVLEGVAVAMAADGDTKALLAAHVDHTAITVSTINKKTKVTVAIANIQVDNLQYETGMFDFAVIATTCVEPHVEKYWPFIWAMFSAYEDFETREADARLLLKTTNETWTVLENTYTELTEVEFCAGPLALYVEDGYVKALARLFRQLSKPRDYDEELAMNEARALRSPLRLNLLNIYPLDLTLTLHTAVRMYIALDQSPLRLSSFKYQNMFISTECLVHALTVHYLSAALLGAGWVVGGLELLGAPGALAARLGGATGGVRGVAQAAAAALLRSLSACAGSLARNLDLLAGDEEHAQRAAAARRHPPDSFVGGVVAGLTNFAINILGAVGGLAHHPLVGMAVGESGSSGTALRRSLLGALTKPLSATADLVAYAGNGLLKQTGWDPVPQPRDLPLLSSDDWSGWHRDCVRWCFRMASLHPMVGYEVLLNDRPLQILLTLKFIVMLAPNTECVIETIDFKDCVMGPYEGGIIELKVPINQTITERETSKEDDNVQVNAAAMARVARYTGAEGSVAEALGNGVEKEGMRTLIINPPTGQSYSLHAAITALIHANTKTHFSLI